MRISTQNILCFLIIFVLLQVTLWFSVRHTLPYWMSVPPAPSYHVFTLSALGDPEFAYRRGGIQIQNLGDSGGRTTSLRAYDFGALKDWFFLMDRASPASSFMPFLAAFYYGGVDEPDKLTPVIDYLAYAGKQHGAYRWRWLAQAVFLARYKQKNLDRAYRLSLDLAALDDPTKPYWAKVMPSFVLKAKGDQEDALDYMLEILKSSADTMDAYELRETIHHVCTKLAQDPKKYDFCGS